MACEICGLGCFCSPFFHHKDRSVHLLEDFGNGLGQHVGFVAAESHSTALYLRTSSVLTLRNISW